MLMQLINVWRGEDGQDLAEYGLVVALIAIVAIAALTLMGTSISSSLSQIAGSI